jgi:hypothetical protein
MADSIKLGLKVVGLDSANCIELAQDRDTWRAILNTVTKLRIAPTAENYST